MAGEVINGLPLEKLGQLFQVLLFCLRNIAMESRLYTIQHNSL